MRPERIKELLQKRIDELPHKDGAWEKGYVCGLEMAMEMVDIADKEAQRVFALGPGSSPDDNPDNFSG